MNFIERMVLKMGLEKVKAVLDGKKTHITQIVAVLVAGVAYLWGPLDFGSIHIPKLEFKELIEILQVGGGFIFARMGIAKMSNKTEEPKQ